MCGRGGLDYSWKLIHDYMNLAGEVSEGGVRMLNVAPSTRRRGEVHWTRIPVVIPDQHGRVLRSMIWPLVPAWLNGELPKFSTANCRSEPDRPFSEVVAKKPTFRSAWKHNRRCLVPFSWFYEWDQRSQPKQPWRIMDAGEPLLVMAGLWEPSGPIEGDETGSFTIVTTEPNQLLAEIGHHRAPVILQPEDWDTWLASDPDRAQALIVPPADGTLLAEKVTRRVNNPEYQGAELAP